MHVNSCCNQVIHPTPYGSAAYPISILPVCKSRYPALAIHKNNNGHLPCYAAQKKDDVSFRIQSIITPTTVTADKSLFKIFGTR
jgi:hypothetical protein